MKRSTILFLAIAVLAAAACVRLGIWQLDRLKTRRAMNAMVASRMSSSGVDVAQIDRDTTRSRFSVAIVHGVPDYEHEVLLTYRGNNGSPGVDLLTPFRLPGTDTAIIVNRGWVYAPDGMTIEPARWRDADTTFTGYVDSFESSTGDSVRQGRIRRADFAAIGRTLPYPILPFYVVALGDTAAASENTSATPRVVRLRRPKLDEGPHLSYAFQWFGFAAISLIGAGIVAARSMHKVSS